VGQPVDGMELWIADDGELLVRGPLVMAGYRDRPDLTEQAIDADGWLHTGDVGRVDDDGYLWIVDRKKELIINAAGKNISPANIEALLKSSGPLIGQACVVGDRRPYIVALLVLDPDTAAGLDPTDADVWPGCRKRSTPPTRTSRARSRSSGSACSPPSGWRAATSSRPR
jgi:long-subunit acyl-CoA synthetase (AMP-forming)